MFSVLNQFTDDTGYYAEEMMFFAAEAAKTRVPPDYDQPTKDQTFKFYRDMKSDNPELFI